jgi:prepilin peptidase CpaA
LSDADVDMFTGSYLHLAGGAVFTALLAAGCITDLRTRKIPNELVLAILVTGWLFAFASPSVGRALGMSLAGTAIGFAIWIPFYLLGVIGAGDVKFFAAAGAWLGPTLTWQAALIAAVTGGILAVVYLLMEKRLGGALRRMALAASSRSLSGIPEQSVVPGVRHRPLPYGVALAIGALAAAWLPRLP